LSGPLTASVIAAAFEAACLAELDALKPGNVHRHGEGHGMSVADFEESARAAAPSLAEPGLSVGGRIRRAVEATMEAVGQNTNLGIVLMCAPLAQAALREEDDLERCVASVLKALTIDDAKEAYAAIRASKAGGLGSVEKHDLASEPDITLLEAMREAEARDRIAWNYTHGFADIFDRGLRHLAEAESHFADQDWAVTDLYLSFLAKIPDTLIARKFGLKTAEQVSENAKQILDGLAGGLTRQERLEILLGFDAALKASNFNPGTTADLTVATLFASALLAAKSDSSG
jgi:triphosphoribosyl-dephospho-CoA synthase